MGVKNITELLRAEALQSRIDARREAEELVRQRGGPGASMVAREREQEQETAGDKRSARHWRQVSNFADGITKRTNQAVQDADSAICDGRDLMRAFHEISDPAVRWSIIEVARLLAASQKHFDSQ